MEAPWSWTTAAAVVSASVGCALSIKRMLGKGQAEHEDHPDISLDPDTQAALQRLGVAIHEVLGRGMFGKVFKGAYQDMVVAVKVAEVSVPRARAKAHLTEVHIAGTLRHPNVVHVHTVAADRLGRPGRAGLPSHSSAGSAASSDSGLRAWSSNDDALSPRLASGSSEASFSYMMPSQVRRAMLESTDEEGPCPMEGTWGSPPRPPPSEFLHRALSVRRRSGSEDSAATNEQPPAVPAALHWTRSEEATSRGRHGWGQDIGWGSRGSGSMLTYRCIFVMEFCDAGTLWMALQQGAYHAGAGRPRLHSLLCTAVEVAEGMAYIHSRRIVHGDLSSRNVLLMRAQAGARPTAKVSDFGLSMLLRPGQEHATAAQHGALAYMPPEMIGADRLSFATDVYSYGVVLWELLTAQTPYAGMSEEQIMHQKLHTAADLQPPRSCPDALAALMCACLNRQHLLRPSFADISARLHALLATFWSDDD